jgi:hypothetical protein
MEYYKFVKCCEKCAIEFSDRHEDAVKVWQGICSVCDSSMYNRVLSVYRDEEDQDVINFLEKNGLISTTDCFDFPKWPNLFSEEQKKNCIVISPTKISDHYTGEYMYCTDRSHCYFR